MESLAIVVLVLFLIAILAGPFAIAISSPRLKSFLNTKEDFAWGILKVLRAVLHFIATSLGFFVGTQLISLATAPAKLIGLWAIITAYIALRREYFPEFFLVKILLTRLGVKRKEEPPVFSADGTEIIRAKKSKRTGRTSGRDSHGPEGQH